MATIGKKRRYPTTSSPHESDDDSGEPATNQLSNKRRGSVAADFAPHRLIVSERQQMAVLKQLTAGDESNTGSQSPSSITPQPRPSKINRRNEHGETIVHIAARKGDLKQLKKVLKAGANVNEADNAGWTPLHEAVTKNQFKAARLLLKSGAHSNAPGPEGQTPLVDAVLNNNTKMAELLLNYSADPTVLDVSRLNETMSRVLKRELSVLDSSDNENNDDESMSPLSPLTSDNDDEKNDDKQHFHSKLVEELDKNLASHSASAKVQRKKPYRGFRERSPHSSDSSTHSKTRTTSGNNNDASSSAARGKNPYDFESEEEGEIRESTNEVHDEQPTHPKKKAVRKHEQSKQRTHSGSSLASNENLTLKKRYHRIDGAKDQEQQRGKFTADDEHLQHIHRIPPLKIVLARAVVQKPPEMESSIALPMEERSTTASDTSPSSLTVPVSEPPPPPPASSEKLSSSPLLPNTDSTSSDVDEKKVMTPKAAAAAEEEEEEQEADDEPSPREDRQIETSSHLAHFDIDEHPSPTGSASCSEALISTLLDQIVERIESNADDLLTSLPIVEDEQMEVDEGDEDDNDDDDIDGGEEEEEEDEEEEGQQQLHQQQQQQQQEEHEQPQPLDNTDATSSMTTAKTEKDQTSSATATSEAPKKRDFKPTTRTLRSHARGILSSSTTSQTSSNANNHGRRVSSRRRALENKLLIVASEKDRKRRTLSERSKKDKDQATGNEDNQTSSNSDDQMLENTHADKVSHQASYTHDDASSCSSTGAGDGSSTSSSTANTKPSMNATSDIDSLPPNKRRLREKNASISIPPTAADPSMNSSSNSTTDRSPVETVTPRDMPVNAIKQFLEIRQQIDKRHETMLNEFVQPRVPKDFAETTMAKKSYLIAPSFSSYSITTPASIGIKRSNPPHDLDAHLIDVFTKQEDERYKMKLRQQVERDKLILSHEQEVLRLHGNATRSLANQDVPFSYCSLLKDNEVYNNPSTQLPEKERHTTMITSDCSSTDLGKRGKHRWNGRSFIKWLEDSNLKYKRLSCELNERQRLEVETLYSMQRMVWLKHLPKESLGLASSGRLSYLLSERYLPKVDINPSFWTHWETGPF